MRGGTCAETSSNTGELRNFGMCRLDGKMSVGPLSFSRYARVVLGIDLLQKGIVHLFSYDQLKNERSEKQSA